MREKETKIQTVARLNTLLGTTSPEEQIPHYKEEVIESLLEYSNTGCSEEFAIELTDVVIIAMGLIHCMGLDFDQLFDEKMQINFAKYSSVPHLMDQGFSRPEALARCKTIWQEREDKKRASVPIPDLTN
jgi:hypothetical protein